MPLRSPQPQLLDYSILFSLLKMVFASASIRLLMVTTEPTVACAPVVGVDSKLYLSNMPRMLNKDITRFMPGNSRVRHNQASELKAALLVVCLQIYC